MRSRAVLVVLLVLAGASLAQENGSETKEARREQVRRSRELLADAVRAIDADSTDAAAGTLRILLDEDPGNADAHFHLGRVHLTRGDTAEAVAILEQGMERAPFSTRIRLLLARQLLARGETAEAGALLDGILAIHQRDGEALYLRGIAHLAGGDTTAALALWRRSLELEVGGGAR